MPRLMSVALTEPQVRAEEKTVTRRLGWWKDKRGRRLLRPGNQMDLCRKVMGRRNGEPLVRIARVEAVSVTRELLCDITDADVTLEGFPGWDAEQFVKFFTRSMKCDPDTEVTRIEFRYVFQWEETGDVSDG